MGGLSGTASIMTIAMMSVERYTCVSRPLDPSSRMTKSRAIAMVVIIWIYSASFSFVPLFGVNRYVPEGYLTSCSFDYLSDNFSSKAFVLVFFGAAYCLPLIIICRCYVGIVLSVYQNQQLFVQQSHSPSVPDRNVENQKRLEIRLAKISVRLISLWTIAWTPYATVALMGVFGSRNLLTPLTSMLPAVFCKFASVLDPFVYALSNRIFKDELARKLLCICKSHRVQNSRSIPSFIRRVIVVDEVSGSLENAEVSYSDEEESETSLTDKVFQLDARKVFSLNALELTHVEAVKERLFRDGCVCHHSDSELNNNAMLNNFTVLEKNDLSSDIIETDIDHTLFEQEEEVLNTEAIDYSTIHKSLVNKKVNNKYEVNITNDRKLSRLKSFDTALNDIRIERNIKKVSITMNNSSFEKTPLIQKFYINEESSNLNGPIISELNEITKVELKSIHVIRIPQVYTIERQNDLIKLKTRRSF